MKPEPDLVTIRPNPRHMNARQLADYQAGHVERFRRLHCASYNACLAKAVDREWEGFHCQQCDAYQRIDYEQIISDAAALNLLRLIIDHENEPLLRTLQSDYPK